MDFTPRSKDRPPSLRLSVLDQVPVRAGRTSQQSIQESIELASLADRCGYHRYWLAEHHNSEALACASPELLIPVIAARTERIRVGTGGIMLPHYSPLKVAEQFRLLESLHPGRIDLGIGRAPGSDRLTASILAYGRSLEIDQYPGQVAHLIDFLAGRSLGTHPTQQVRATPDDATEPELWLLGSGIDSAVLAGQLGCAYSHAHFINPESAAVAVDRYRSEFQPGVLQEPVVNLGISALCAETNEQAERLSMSRYLWWVKLTKGDFGPFPSLDEVDDYPYSDRDQAVLEKLRRRSLVGDPTKIRRLLGNLASELDINELVILTITHGAAERQRSYQLLAETFAHNQSPDQSTESTTLQSARNPSTNRGDGRPSNASGTR